MCIVVSRETGEILEVLEPPTAAGRAAYRRAMIYALRAAIKRTVLEENAKKENAP